MLILLASFLLGIPLGSYYGLRASRWYYTTVQLPKASWNQKKKVLA